MTITLSYALTLKESVSLDDIRSTIDSGFAAYTASSADPDRPVVVYSVIHGAPNTVSVQVRLDPKAIGFAGNGCARLITILSGNAFRDSRIERTILQNISVSPAIPELPGPANGPDLFDRTRFNEPLISVPIPRKLALNDWDKTCRELITSGVRILTDMTLLLSPDDLVQRAARTNHLAETLGDTVLFVNVNGNLAHLLRTIDTLEECRSNFSALTLGVRLCPMTMGFSVFEMLRTRRIPIYAYTLGPTTDGVRGWSPTAYSALMNLIGADIVNVGLLTASELERGVVYEITAPLTATGETTKPTVPAFTGGIYPEVAYKYGTKFPHPHLLHTMTPILGGEPTQRTINTRVQAIREAHAVGASGRDPAKLFAARAKLVRNWQAYEESALE